MDIENLAQRVIKGEFGSGKERKVLLGGNYEKVQQRVNEILGSNKPKYDIDDLARRAIRGEFGNGFARKSPN